MNWQLEGKSSDIDGIEPEVMRAADEDPEAMPSEILDSARVAANNLVTTLGPGECYVTIAGHERVAGDDFRTAHVAVTVSRIDTSGA